MGSDIAKWMRDRRDELGLSRMQLAAKTKNQVSYSSIVKYELGQALPTARALRSLAVPLKVDAVWLLRQGGHLPSGTKAPEPEPTEEAPRDPRQLVKWLRGDPSLTEEDAKVIAQNYEHIRRMRQREQGGSSG